ncbi:d-alanine aminotransferase [Alcanivorax hongdengensis A-11-3]|uniref:D-alanine aminotransferase n=1 Tax=Alcanivorax hongdengensis A-11-3 TaxID=1177179 RepID=L0WI08_9GAMM|nr:D-amino-acid transaminase [Alcanivorax hongdengensis]EKF75792.1 d-alanine aminotransferase [Alcanivorax hongdengensis A-11-3]
MSQVYLNGAFMAPQDARISPMDRGFLFADGIYEVIPAYNGVLFRFDEHLDRLERSLREVQIINPHSRAQWQALCEDLIARNNGGNISVYLQISRGMAEKRDHAFPDPPVVPTVFMMTSPIAVPAADSPDTARGYGAITRDDIRWARCDIKSVSLLPNSLLRQQAVAAGAAEAILLRDGFVTEGSASNVFIVQSGTIITPPRSHAILGGITRDLVVELCHQHGLPLEERELTETELRQADEIWITSSTKEVVPITTLNGHPVGQGQPGPVWKALAHHYVRHKRRLCGLD